MIAIAATPGPVASAVIRADQVGFGELAQVCRSRSPVRSSERLCPGAILPLWIRWPSSTICDIVIVRGVVGRPSGQRSWLTASSSVNLSPSIALGVAQRREQIRGLPGALLGDVGVEELFEHLARTQTASQRPPGTGLRTRAVPPATVSMNALFKTCRLSSRGSSTLRNTSGATSRVTARQLCSISPGRSAAECTWSAITAASLAVAPGRGGRERRLRDPAVGGGCSSEVHRHGRRDGRTGRWK